MSPDRKSSTAILAGQIASALIGFALGVVVTLLAIVDWPPAAARPAAAPAVAPAPAPAPQAASAPAPPPATPPAQSADTAAAPPTDAAQTAAVAPAVVAPVAPAPAPAPPPAPAAAEPPAPPPAAKPPQPKPKPAEPSPSRARYVVQAGAFVSDEIAGKVAARLTAHDHPAEVLVRTDDSGRAWNVVRVSEIFATRGEAERLANALKRNDDVDTLIIRLSPVKPEEPPAAASTAAAPR